MRIFLDTANIDEIREAARLGILSGVTTNPTLMAKESGIAYRDRVVEICEVVKGPVSAECVSRDVPGLLEEARAVAAWHEHVGVRINMTLVFSTNQALLAALAGATYVSVFVGRLDDAGHDGMEVVREVVEMFDRYHLPAQMLAASLRHPRHVVAAARAGAHIATMPYAVFKAMIKHPLTDVGIERFLADARRYMQV
jgi:transaldolase